MRNKIQSLIDKKIDLFAKNHFLKPVDETKKEDIFIVGYPKSGNTLMQLLITSLYYNMDPDFVSDKLSQFVVTDVHARKYYADLNSVNFFKTHNLPQSNYKRVIYIIRDGRDTIVSYYHYNNLVGKSPSLYEMIVNGKGVFPCEWHEHVEEWKNNPYNADMIAVKYEDLLSNRVDELDRIASIIGVSRSNDDFNRIAKGSTIEKTRNKARENNGMGNVSLTGEKGVKFFRKGKSGSYLKEMTPELIAAFNKKAKKQLIENGYTV